jgi:hypothetical protein
LVSTNPSERTTPGWFDVSSLLVDFVISTWSVAPSRLAELLPDGIQPDVFTLPSGTAAAFVSAVSFVNTRFSVGFAPFVEFTAPQTNYRAYIRRGDERAVWFCHTLFDSFTVVLPRHVFGMPWTRMRVAHEAEWTGEHLERLRWQARSRCGEEELHIEGRGEPIGPHEGFAVEAEARRVLTHPLVGYFRSPGGRVGRYGVGHAPLELERCRATRVRYELFERLGLIEPHQPPLSILAQRATHYTIFLPPRRVAW